MEVEDDIIKKLNIFLWSKKMATKDLINISQFVTDKDGHKISAIIDIGELKRVEELLEDLSDLKAIEEREDEPVEDYEAYSRERRSHQGV